MPAQTLFNGVGLWELLEQIRVFGRKRCCDERSFHVPNYNTKLVQDGSLVDNQRLYVAFDGVCMIKRGSSDSETPLHSAFASSDLMLQHTLPEHGSRS